MIQFQTRNYRIIEIEVEEMSFVFARFHEKAPFLDILVLELLSGEYIVEDIPYIFFRFSIDDIALGGEFRHERSQDP